MTVAMVKAIAVGLLLACGAPCLAQPAGPAQIIEPSPDQQTDNKIVCKMDAVSGSRLQTRTCHSTKEWAAIREESMREMKSAADASLPASDSLSPATPN